MSFFEPYLHTPSAVLSDGIVPVPLWAVTQLSIDSTYFVPQVGGTRRRVAVVSHDDSLSLSAVLLGPLRFTWKVALENLAESSRQGTALSRVTGGTQSGLVLITTATIRTDLAVQSLTFSQSAQRRDTLDVTLRLLHLPRPGSLAKLLDVASIGVGALTDALPV
ncbi:hypothetical protein [Amycolatopsis sp. cmx-4-68]|uniref:hypothetical protein n=1 Tax=Amycolatopsis sp. cmx-4-68 TaxID=2790938 RepID=UPI003977F3A5